MTSRPFSHLWSSRRTRFNHMINRFEANSSTNHGILIFDHILMIKQFSGFGLLWQSDQGEYLPLWMWGRSVRIKNEFEIDQPLELGAASRIFSWPFLQPLRENAVWLSTTVLQSSAHSTYCLVSTRGRGGWRGGSDNGLFGGSALLACLPCPPPPPVSTAIGGHRYARRALQ